MQTMDRRSFLLGPFAQSENRNAQLGASPVIRIGTMADFPVGKEMLVGAGSILLESLPEGLRARNPDNDTQYFGIHVTGTGAIMVNRGESWSKNTVFSILTCGPTSL